MKKIFIIVALLLATSLQLGAVPASKTGFIWTQPDGSKITLYRCGDEFYHWTCDSQGAVYTLTEDGWYRRSSSTPKPASFQNENRRRQAAQMRAAYHVGSDMTHGSRHIPVILVEFSDKYFSITDPASAFTALLNQEGYRANGGTGSVKDYYVDNSGGQFIPIFDVYGPVRLNRNMAYYGANDSSDNDMRPEIALYDALLKLDETVDFSIYDSDNDGDVDMTLFYYAGWNEAEGASEDTIWPHQWSLDNSSNSSARNNSFDGVHFGRYFCSSELKGFTGSNMCGIGTTCHEFAHSLGLPDFYDTDYTKNGEAGALYTFSLMCSGAYNNNGCTPPYMIAEERIMLGWMEGSAMQEITESGSYTLQSVENNVAYKISTDTEGEYFYLETRDGLNWDKYLPAGLLVYHVDKSKDRTVGSGFTPYELWTYWESSNAINKWGAHPCFYIVPAKNQSSLNYSGYMRDVVFPTSSGNVTSYQPVDWNGIETAAKISSIAYSSYKVTFNATVTNTKGISGTVTDTSGNPLQGVTIQVAPAGQVTTSSNGRVRIISARGATDGAPYSAQTDAQGHYSIDLQDCSATDVNVSATLDGYVDAAKSVTLKPKGNVLDFQLRKAGESQPTALYKYNTNASNASGMGIDATNIMASVRFSEQELAPYAGDLIQSVSFLPTCDAADALYIIIDFGNTRALTYQVPNPSFMKDLMTVSLESQNLHIPESGPVYFGYGVDVAVDDSYAIGCVQSASGFNGSYYGLLNLNSSSWYELSNNSGTYFDLVYSVTVLDDGDPGTVTPPEEDPITSAGFSYINVPKDFSFTSGAVFPLKLVLGNNINPSSIVWSLDGKSVQGESITLTSGNHTLRATLYYLNGSDETIELEIEVL